MVDRIRPTLAKHRCDGVDPRVLDRRSWIAGGVAIALSLCPKVGAAISAVPPGVLGVRIWLTNHVEFALPVDQMTAAIALIIGIADFTWRIGTLTFTGIALGSIAALVVYHCMRVLGILRGGVTGCHRPATPPGGVSG
jgi:xanthine/uracil permease